MREIFAGHIKTRTGRYPILYTNHDTAKYIATHRDNIPILSRLPLWYARYKPEIKSVFPMGNWENYMLWQFSSATNCGKKTCPMRIEGTLDDIDVNTVPMTKTELAAIWKQGDLLPERPPELQYLVQRHRHARHQHHAGLVHMPRHRCKTRQPVTPL